MNKDETREAIKVMEHFTNGGEIEGRVLGEDDSWNVFIDPHWNFNHFAYRIKKAPRTFWIAQYDDDDEGEGEYFLLVGQEPAEQGRFSHSKEIIKVQEVLD